MECIFCGCTDEAACMVDVAKLDPEALSQLYRMNSRIGLRRFVDAHGRTPCWWFQLEPPVCSAPVCVAALREREHAHQETRS